MKKVIFLIFFLHFFCCFSQEKKDLVIFENSKKWKNEIIKFPIEWAPNIKLNGFEELLFSPNWNDSKSNDFWSLVLGWKINSTQPLAINDIEYNLINYFDGLMKPNHWAEKFPEPIVKLKKNKNGFNGTMRFFDGFHTGKLITVNILGQQHFNRKLKKSIVVFRLSPKNYQHKIWESLNSFYIKRSEFDLINLDSTWGQEVIRFPARDMNYIGVGDIRFPPKGWINPKHPFFWSYTYAWNINLNEKITTKELEIDLVKYFNSLNRVDVNEKADNRKASAIITEIKTITGTTFFEGKVDTYDRFATNKRFTLYVKIESNLCEKTKRTILLFTFSPKEFSHKVWETLNNIELEKGFCAK